MSDHPLHLTGHARLDALGWPQPIPIATLGDFLAWAEAWEAARVVADDTVGGVRVSTIFTGFMRPHRIDPFETMLEGDHPWAGDYWRYATWPHAWAGHHALLAQLRWP
jgi:hypothetical protein